METKVFEIRDRATYIPVLATKLYAIGDKEEERYHARRLGFGVHHVIITKMDIKNASVYDAHDQPSGNRTMFVAHEHIQNFFDTLSTGDVIDVEFILEETKTKKESERLNYAN